MTRIRPRCFNLDFSDRSRRADVLLREEPDDEEEEEEDEGNVTDDEEDDEGYTGRVYRVCDEG